MEQKLSLATEAVLGDGGEKSCGLTIILKIAALENLLNNLEL